MKVHHAARIEEDYRVHRLEMVAPQQPPQLVREPAVAGLFYPDDPNALRSELARCLGVGGASEKTAPRAIIAPHAGYRYSGAIAGEAFSVLRDRDSSRASVVFILGPPHRVPVDGFALPEASTMRTPLGDASLHEEICGQLLDRPDVVRSAEAHAQEHSLEVEIPFVQRVFGVDVALVPLLVGEASSEQVAQILEEYWDYPGVRFVISSDLSHFLDYRSAQARDQRTVERIVSLSRPDLNGEDACGFRAVNGLIEFAADNRLEPRLLRLENSGDHGGSSDRVVGYGALGFWEAP